MNVKKLEIGLDFDGVIASTPLLKPLVAKELFGIEIDPADFRRDFVVGGGYLTDEQYLKVGQETYGGKYLPEPVPGALEGISILLSEGHSLRVITSRSEGDLYGQLAPAKEWLKDRGVNIPVIGVGYGVSKSFACEGLDVFIDDGHEKLEHLKGIVSHILFYRWPYNDDRTQTIFTSVRSWEEIVDYVRKING